MGVVREDSEEVTIQLFPEWQEGAKQVKCRGKGIQGKRNGDHKGPEKGTSMTCSGDTDTEKACGVGVRGGCGEMRLERQAGPVVWNCVSHSRQMGVSSKCKKKPLEAAA